MPAGESAEPAFAAVSALVSTFKDGRTIAAQLKERRVRRGAQPLTESLQRAFEQGAYEIEKLKAEGIEDYGDAYSPDVVIAEELKNITISVQNTILKEVATAFEDDEMNNFAAAIDSIVQAKNKAVAILIDYRINPGTAPSSDDLQSLLHRARVRARATKWTSQTLQIPPQAFAMSDQKHQLEPRRSPTGNLPSLFELPGPALRHVSTTAYTNNPVKGGMKVLPISESNNFAGLCKSAYRVQNQQLYKAMGPAKKDDEWIYHCRECKHCLFADTAQRDSPHFDDHIHTSSSPISFRQIFLWKSHIASLDRRLRRYACLLCLLTGRKSAIYQTENQLFEHIVQHANEVMVMDLESSGSNDLRTKTVTLQGMIEVHSGGVKPAAVASFDIYFTADPRPSSGAEEVDVQDHAHRTAEDPLSVDIDAEISDGDSEMSDVPSLVSDSTEFSVYTGYEAVVEHMVELLREDEKTQALYRSLGQQITIEQFIRVHDQVLKTYFQDLRNEVKSTNELLAVRTLRNAPQRKEITLHVLKFFNFVETGTDIESAFAAGTPTGREKNRRHILNAILQNSYQKRAESENVSDPQDDDASDSSLSDGESEKDVQPEEILSPLQAIESFLTKGRAFARLQINLGSIINRPRTLEEAISSDSTFVVKRFIFQDYGRMGETQKNQILQMRREGRSNTQIAKFLLMPQSTAEADIEVNKDETTLFSRAGDPQEVAEADTEVKEDEVLLPLHGVDTHETSKAYFEVKQNETLVSSNAMSSLLVSLRRSLAEYLRSVSNALIVCERLRHLGYLVESCIAIRPPEKITLKWKCKCGQRRMFNLKSSSLTAAGQLGARLTQHAQQPATANTSSPVSSSNAASGPTATSTTHKGDASTINPPEPTLNPCSTVITHYTPQQNLQIPRYLLVCVNNRKYDVALAQVSCHQYNNDQSLFADIRQAYEKISLHRLRWYSFMLPFKVELVKFMVVPRTAPSSKKQFGQHVGILAVPSIPPEEEVTKFKRYHYEPCPLDENEPFLPMDDFLHALFDPREHTQNFWVQSLPKKLLQELHYINTSTRAIGWGVHIIEKPNMLLVTVVLIAILVSTAIFCVLWTTVRHGTIQDAYSMGAFIITSETLTLSLLFFLWQQPQIHH